MEPKNAKWEDRARLYLKAAIKRADLTYDDLAKRLTDEGIPETAATIANKLSRGTFAATFFLAALSAIGVETIRLEDL